jgi:hypothetical protein
MEQYGPDWVFSPWIKDDLAWCRAAYERFGAAISADAEMLTSATPVADSR